jgi:hypothetical protein
MLSRSQYRKRCGCLLGARLNSTEKNQDQKNHDDKSKPTAAVISRSVEWAATKSAEPTKQNDDQDYYKYGSNRHEVVL